MFQSVMFLIGLWIFSFQYLVTACELSHLFNQVSEATIWRFKIYRCVGLTGLALCVLLGPFQYNDWTLIYKLNVNETSRSMILSVVKCSAIGNSLAQLAMIGITFYSLIKISKFISFYPGLQINKTTTVVHCILLVLLALSNISLVTTIQIFFRRNG